jgi:GxxExxY protein
MRELFSRADQLSSELIGAAIEAHRFLGPGLLESICERCLIHELKLRGMNCASQRLVRIDYKGCVFEEPLRLDVLVENCLLLEVKAVQAVIPIHKAQLLSYMKILNIPLGLIINFHAMKLVDDVSRLILPGANQSNGNGPV